MFFQPERSIRVLYERLRLGTPPYERPPQPWIPILQCTFEVPAPFRIAALRLKNDDLRACTAPGVRGMRREDSYLIRLRKDASQILGDRSRLGQAAAVGRRHDGDAPSAHGRRAVSAYRAFCTCCVSIRTKPTASDSATRSSLGTSRRRVGFRENAYDSTCGSAGSRASTSNNPPGTRQRYACARRCSISPAVKCSSSCNALTAPNDFPSEARSTRTGSPCRTSRPSASDRRTA